MGWLVSEEAQPSGSTTAGGRSSASISPGAGTTDRPGPQNRLPSSVPNCHRLRPKNVAFCHPLYQTSNSLRDLKTRNPPPADRLVFKALRPKTDRPQTAEPPKAEPTLRNIVPADLREPERLFELHAQAVDSGLVGSSESDRLKFFAAAEHARVIGTTNPCGLFARLVRSKLWHYLTQDDEDAANRRLKGFLFGGAHALAAALPSMPGIGGGLGQAVPRPVLSDDARFVRDVTQRYSASGRCPSRASGGS